MPKFNCPYCDEELETILYSDFGQKVWDGEKWKEDEGCGEIEYRCPHCDALIEYTHLKEMGVV